MPNVSISSPDLRRVGLSTSSVDKCSLVALSAFAYTLIIAPLLSYGTNTASLGSSAASQIQHIMTPRLENKLVWPMLAGITVVLVLRNRSRVTLPPHIVSLFAYLALAGASVLWAFKPELSLQRFVLLLLIVVSIVFPVTLAARTTDLIRGMFICFAFALIVNVFFILNQTPIIIDKIVKGYPGYFAFKGILGECAAVAFLLSLHEMLYSGRRLALGISVAVVAICVMILSQSKGALGLALLTPWLAGLSLIAGKMIRVSPAIVLLPIVFGYEVLSRLLGNLTGRISYYLYGNYTMSGRANIWEFVHYESVRKPLFGWGYQSFWFVGPDGPSVVDAPGWIKVMPSAHNGYLDTKLELGYVGLSILVIFIFATLHAIGHVAGRDTRRAWLLLSLALFIILTNFVESSWMRGMDILWLTFLFVAAEIARYWPGGSARRFVVQQQPS